MLLAQEIIRRKRDGHSLADAEIESFVRGLVDRSWSDAQAAAFAMAVCLRGLDRTECVALTRAMTHSGALLDWTRARLPGPIVDKHSTGGVGDKVSLVLAPIVAACGGVVPMVSGRGLGHTGGTRDKLAALPGYTVTPTRSALLAVLRGAGCAIVGASARIAPADRRLYAIRDVTATIESVPLITASILSKKLAAGLGSLVMDVKVGNGAFCPDLASARALAASLVEVAAGAGLPTRALITNMDQVLGHSAGNAVEVRESIEFLTGARRDARLLELTLALAAQMLCGAGLDATLDAARDRARNALDSGAAAQRFARMVAGLGGPRDVLVADGLPRAPVRRDVPAACAGVVAAMDTRAVGLAIVALGGGRQRGGERIDPSVGITDLLPLGSAVSRGTRLACVHAATDAQADAAVQALRAAITVDARAARPATPVVHEAIAGT